MWRNLFEKERGRGKGSYGIASRMKLKWSHESLCLLSLPGLVLKKLEGEPTKDFGVLWFLVWRTCNVSSHHLKCSVFTRHHTRLIPYAFHRQPWDSPTATSRRIERLGRRKEKRLSNNAGEVSPKIETRWERDRNRQKATGRKVVGVTCVCVYDIHVMSWYGMACHCL